MKITKKKIDSLVDTSQKYETPMVLVRPYRMEEVLKI